VSNKVNGRDETRKYYWGGTQAHEVASGRDGQPAYNISVKNPPKIYPDNEVPSIKLHGPQIRVQRSLSLVEPINGVADSSSLQKLLPCLSLLTHHSLKLLSPLLWRIRLCHRAKLELPAGLTL
jgi:hypothetical protein